MRVRDASGGRVRAGIPLIDLTGGGLTGSGGRGRIRGVMLRGGLRGSDFRGVFEGGVSKYPRGRRIRGVLDAGRGCGRFLPPGRGRELPLRDGRGRCSPWSSSRRYSSIDLTGGG